MGRVPGVRRLSHDTDVITSIEGQGESIEAWAKAYGHTVVATTDDTGVSGSITPQDRYELCPVAHHHPAITSAWTRGGHQGQATQKGRPRTREHPSNRVVARPRIRLGLLRS